MKKSLNSNFNKPMENNNPSMFLCKLSLLLIILLLSILFFSSPWLFPTKGLAKFLLPLLLGLFILRLANTANPGNLLSEIKQKIDHYLLEILILGVVGFLLTTYVFVPFFTPQLHIVPDCIVSEKGYRLTLNNKANIGDNDFTLIIKDAGITPVMKHIKDQYFELITNPNMTTYFYNNTTYSFAGKGLGVFLDEGDYFSEENATILEGFAKRYCSLNLEIIDNIFVNTIVHCEPVPPESSLVLNFMPDRPTFKFEIEYSGESTPITSVNVTCKKSACYGFPKDQLLNLWYFLNDDYIDEFCYPINGKYRGGKPVYFDVFMGGSPFYGYEYIPNISEDKVRTITWIILIFCLILIIFLIIVMIKYRKRIFEFINNAKEETKKFWNLLGN